MENNQEPKSTTVEGKIQNHDAYRENFDRIFRKKNKVQETNTKQKPEPKQQQ